MPNNFTIEGRALAAGFKDVQRSWLWELTIIPPGIINVDSNRILVHCRSAVIPGRSQEMITSNFGGMKQYFPGKPEFPGTFSVNIEETEDMYIRKFLNKWQEVIFGTSDKVPNQGYSMIGEKKLLVATTLELQLFKYNGEMTDYKFRFINGIIQSVGDVTVSYDSGDSVKYDATFQYDYFDLVKN